MKTKLALAALFIILIPLTVSPLFPLSLTVRTYDHPGFTRLVFESNQKFHYNIIQTNTKLEVHLKEKVELKEDIVTQSVLIDKVIHHIEKNKSVFNIFLKSPFKVQRSFMLEKPFRAVFDLANSGEITAKEEPKETKKEEIKNDKDKNDKNKIDQTKIEPPKVKEEKEPEKNQEIKEKAANEGVNPLPSPKNLVIETICIDPGHGGGDIGAVGKGDIVEKNITLNVGKMLRQLIMSRLGLQVVMTRETDAEVSLNTRVSIANNRKAHMFVSIHVNSSFRKAARGSETFFVSLKATDQEAFQLSQKENQSPEENGGETGDVIQDDELKMILWDMAQTEYIKESSRLAEYIQEELNVLLQTKNRGVKQAPFRVLMRAAMPAVLVEIAFLSNIEEEKKLLDDNFLNTVADAIYTGISRYIHYYNNPAGPVNSDKQKLAQQ